MQINGILHEQFIYFLPLIGGSNRDFRRRSTITPSYRQEYSPICGVFNDSKSVERVPLVSVWYVNNFCFITITRTANHDIWGWGNKFTKDEGERTMGVTNNSSWQSIYLTSSLCSRPNYFVAVCKLFVFSVVLNWPKQPLDPLV